MDKISDNPAPPPPGVLSYAADSTDSRERSFERYFVQRSMEKRLQTLTLLMAVPAFLGAILGVITLTFGLSNDTLFTLALLFAPAAIVVTQALALDKLMESLAAVIVVLVTSSLLTVLAVGIAVLGVIALQAPGALCYVVPVLAYDGVCIYFCARVLIDIGKYLTLTRSRS